MTTTMPQRKQDLIRALYGELKAASEVTATQGVPDILAAYSDGATIGELEKLHSHYSPEHGRIFPFFEEDFSEDESADLPDTLPEDDAIAEVVYEWGFLIVPETIFDSFAFHLSELSNAISDLISFHPDYDGDYGVIR